MLECLFTHFYTIFVPGSLFSELRLQCQSLPTQARKKGLQKGSGHVWLWF